MSVPEILIIEDEQRVQNLIKNTLKRGGYNTHQALTLQRARNILKKQHIDLICLDINLPDGDGLKFGKKIRDKYGEEIKIIVLTKNTGPKERVASFEIGADDYVAKPFYPSELIQRVKKQLNGRTREVNRLDLNEKRSVLMIDSTEVYLTTSEYYFIEALLLEKVETREELATYVSTKRDKKLSDTSLTVLATRLRKKIKEDTGEEIFTSHYSKGYRLTL